MKALKYILFLLLIAIIGSAIYIAVQPNSFEVSRTKTIKAPAPVIYNNIIDFKNWEAWSPWIEKEPSTKINLSEQTKGVGGSYSWTDKDGSGIIHTLETVPNTSIQQVMQFADFPVSNISWNFKPNEDGSTHTTWSISGKDLPFGFKAYMAFSGGMEKQIGPDFERGLEKLDSILQVSMKVYSIKVNGITQHSGGFYLYNTTSCKIDELSNKMQDMLPKLMSYVEKNNITMAGAPYVNYHKWDEENNAVMFSCCAPTVEKVITDSDSDILTGQLQPFKALKTTLKGDYKNSKEAWKTAMAYIAENNLKQVESGPSIETYLTIPENTPNPADYITEIYIAVK
jgi:effector-binding domain-containing protein